MNTRVLISVVVLAALGGGFGAALYGSGNSDDRSDAADIRGSAPPRRTEPMMLAQISTKCATRSGICILRRPQQVGTSCECNGEPGRVVR